MKGKGKLGMLLIGGPEEGDDEEKRDEGDDTAASDTLEMAAEELIDAVSKKDTGAVAEALRSAFAACREMH